MDKVGPDVDPSSTISPSQPTVVPNSWQGETDCMVGPFSSEPVAKYFATWVVSAGDPRAVASDVFARGDGWYLRITS